MYQPNGNIFKESEGLFKTNTKLSDKSLTPVEKIFLLHVERGDCATVRRYL